MLTNAISVARREGNELEGIFNRVGSNPSIGVEVEGILIIIRIITHTKQRQTNQSTLLHLQTIKLMIFECDSREDTSNWAGESKSLLNHSIQEFHIVAFLEIRVLSSIFIVLSDFFLAFFKPFRVLKHKVWHNRSQMSSSIHASHKKSNKFIDNIALNQIILSFIMLNSIKKSFNQIHSSLISGENTISFSLLILGFLLLNNLVNDSLKLILLLSDLNMRAKWQISQSTTKQIGESTNERTR
mmetsp:Transcript_146809/g.208075  ORF Transcript_146809/g.208075 Transcript_146809/m.208075 type:complete len:242 (-) Transcript_146809:702-1427(-)